MAAVKNPMVTDSTLRQAKPDVAASDEAIKGVIQKVWRALQNDVFTQLPTVINARFDPLKVRVNLPEPKNIIVVSKKMMLVFLKHIGHGSFKMVFKAIMCTPSETAHRTVEKTVAIWLARGDKTSAGKNIKSDIHFMNSFSFSTIIPAPIKTFYIRPGNDSSIVVVNKLYKEDGISFLTRLANKDPEAFSVEDFIDIMSYFIDIQYATFCAHGHHQILCDLKPDNVLVEERDGRLRFVVSDLGMTISEEEAKLSWSKAVHPLEKDIVNMLQDPAFESTRPLLYTVNAYKENCRKQSLTPRAESISVLEKIHDVRRSRGYERGTIGYIPPEEKELGYWSCAKDIYALGHMLGQAYYGVPGFKKRLDSTGLHTVFTKLIKSMTHTNYKRRINIRSALDIFHHQIIAELPVEMGRNTLGMQSLALFKEISANPGKENGEEESKTPSK